MRIVADGDDVVAAAIGLVRIRLLIELLKQRKDMRLVLAEQVPQMHATGSTAQSSVVVHHTVTSEGLVDLRIKVVTVGQHRKVKLLLKWAELASLPSIRRTFSQSR